MMNKKRWIAFLLLLAAIGVFTTRFARSTPTRPASSESTQADATPPIEVSENVSAVKSHAIQGPVSAGDNAQAKSAPHPEEIEEPEVSDALPLRVPDPIVREVVRKLAPNLLPDETNPFSRVDIQIYASGEETVLSINGFSEYIMWGRGTKISGQITHDTWERKVRVLTGNIKVATPSGPAVTIEFNAQVFNSWRTNEEARGLPPMTAQIKWRGPIRLTDKTEPTSSRTPSGASRTSSRPTG